MRFHFSWQFVGIKRAFEFSYIGYIKIARVDPNKINITINTCQKKETAEDPDEINSATTIENLSDCTEENDTTDDKFLKIVQNITSKGFVRSNLEEKLVDLSDVRINLKTKI